MEIVLLTRSLTSASKFFSPATLTQTQPSFRSLVGTLYDWLGTAEMTTSEIARQSARDMVVGVVTWWGLDLDEVVEEDGLFENSWIAIMSASSRAAPAVEERRGVDTYNRYRQIGLEHHHWPATLPMVVRRPLICSVNIVPNRVGYGDIPINDGDDLSSSSVTIIQHLVVNTQMLQNLDDCQWGTR
jgi:hypothetical protein